MLLSYGINEMCYCEMFAPDDVNILANEFSNFQICWKSEASIKLELEVHA